MAKVRVASVDEVPVGVAEGGAWPDDTEICLAHAEDGNFYAINDVCTHENFLLSGGELFELRRRVPAARLAVQPQDRRGDRPAGGDPDEVVPGHGGRRDVYVEVPD